MEGRTDICDCRVAFATANLLHRFCSICSPTYFYNVLYFPATFSLDCGHDGELLPDVTNCRKYFKCSNGRPSTQSCPGTLIFDPVLKICNWPDSTSCVQEKPKVLQLINWIHMRRGSRSDSSNHKQLSDS